MRVHPVHPPSTTVRARLAAAHPPAAAARRLAMPLAAVLVLALAAVAAHAQVQIDKRRPASKSGEVYVESSFGSVKVVGWDKEEVAVTGVLAAGAEGLEFDGEKNEIYVRVSEPHDWSYGSGDDTEFRSGLVVNVPKGSSVHVQTVNASIDVEGISGVADIETTNGTVRIAGTPRAVQIETITGPVEATASAAEMRVETVSAAVTLRGAAREVQVRSVSGAIDVQGRDLERVELSTTAGDVHLDGTFRGNGGVAIETHAGNVALDLPADVAARFHVQTFSGKIVSDTGPKPRKSERYSPFQELRFATAETDFEIEVKTFAGDVTIRRGGAGKSPGSPDPAKPGAR